MNRFCHYINPVLFMIILSLFLPAAGMAGGYLDNPRIARAQQQADRYYEEAYEYKQNCLFDSYRHKLRQLNALEEAIEAEMQTITDPDLRDQWNRLQADIILKMEFLMLKKVNCGKGTADGHKLIHAPGDKSILRNEDLFTFYKPLYVVYVGDTFEVVVDQYPLTFGSSLLGIFDRTPGIVSAPALKQSSRGTLSRLHDLLDEWEEEGYDPELDGQPFNKGNFLRMLPNVPIVRYRPRHGKVNRSIVSFRCLKVGRTVLHFEFETARRTNPSYNVQVRCIARKKTDQEKPGTGLQEGRGEDVTPGGVPPVKEDKDEPKKSQQKGAKDTRQSSRCLPADKFKTVDLGPKPGGFENVVKGIAGSLLGQVTGGMLSFGGGDDDKSGGTYLSDNPFADRTLQTIRFDQGMDFQLAGAWLKTTQPVQEKSFFDEDEEDDFYQPQKKQPASESKPAPVFSVKVPKKMAREKKYTFADMYLIGPGCQEKNPSKRYIYEIWQETKFSWSIEFWHWRNGVLTEHWHRTGSEQWSELLASGEIPLWVGARFDGITEDLLAQGDWQLITHWTYEDDGRMYMDSRVFDVSAQPDAAGAFKFMPLMNF